MKTAILSLLCLLVTVAAGQVVGPVVGQVGHSDARFLYRTDGAAKELRVQVLNAAGVLVGSDTRTTAAASDYTAHFHVTGLAAATRYDYRIEQIDGATTLLAGGDGMHHFRTFPAPGERTVFTAAFVSCADGSSEPVWQRMDSLNLNALFLMGDTPYIDSTVLATARQKHRDFLTTPMMKNLIRHVPTSGAWDDHDFGLNNGNGVSVPNKANTRQAFVEYRAHAQYGTGTEGIFNKVSAGPMDVFLLDVRWFAQTGPSPVSPTQKTGYGSAQWTWLRDALKQSRATFKVLAFGAIWQDKKGGENDDMQTYWYERDALLDFIKAERIAGVVLLGGDIHISRHLAHPQRVGYDLHDFVTSPAHTSTIPSLAVYNPDLEWTSLSDRQFLTLSVDTRTQPPVLTAKFIKSDGTVQRTVTVPYDQLVPREGAEMARDLRAYWPLDGNLENRSTLGARLDAATVNGTAVATTGGIRGGAATLARGSSQYLQVGRSVLPENSAQFTVSLWAKAATLPAHGSADRFFLLETTPEGTTSTATEGFGISMGIDAASVANKVNVALNTFTLQPAAASANGTTSPTNLAQGPFTVQVDRTTLLNQWTNFVLKFDSTQLRVFVNSVAVGTFPLPTPGPLAENGGLIIGGHRSGTGRNFNGQMDEVAIWSRALTDAEITTLGSTEIATATTVVDSDGDSLPDWWENIHGLNAQSSSDAIGDDDGDKVPAFIEFSLGTSPLSDDTKYYTYIRQVAAPGQSPDTTAFRDPATGNTTLRLRLESSPDLVHWTDVPLGTPEAGIEMLEGLLKLKLPAPGAEPRFYRFKAGARQP